MRFVESAHGFHNVNRNAEPLHKVCAQLPCEGELGSICRGKIRQNIVQEVDVVVWRENGIHERLFGPIDERGESDFLIQIGEEFFADDVAGDDHGLSLGIGQPLMAGIDRELLMVLNENAGIIVYFLYQLYGTFIAGDNLDDTLKAACRPCAVHPIATTAVGK
ncbi:MAG: hypothetical protein IPK52_12575 [Chloroflexi bacterium]|nr:hypothetical protein [Chloroflexota bacterium]